MSIFIFIMCLCILPITIFPIISNLKGSFYYEMFYLTPKTTKNYRA